MPIIVVYLLIFFFAFLIRILLSPVGFHVDIFSNAAWGEWVYENGPLGFYTNSIWVYSWPTQPPFVSLLYAFDRFLYEWLLELFRWIGNTIVTYRLAPSYMRWWFAFTIWFDQAKINTEIPFTLGYLSTIKLPAILADLGIAALIYQISTKAKQKKSHTILYILLYLFSPFSIYLSSLWGQYDQLAFLPLLASFYLLTSKKYIWIAPILLALSIAIKPTGILLLLLFIYLYCRQTTFWKNVRLLSTYTIVPAVVILSFFIVTTQVFPKSSLLEFLPVLYEKIFLKSEMRVSTNSFNFWRIFIGNQGLSQNTLFLFLPAYFWSVLFFFLLHLALLKKRVLQKITTKSIVLSVFIVSAGSFLFMTNMLDRYFFTGIVSGLLVCIFYPHIIKYWIILSLIFFLNLYNQWFFPEWFPYLKGILTWNESFITRILSFINVVLYGVMVKHILWSKK